jgi:hypothetical protein
MCADWAPRWPWPAPSPMPRPILMSPGWGKKNRAMPAGLPLLTCGACANVIRFLWPLTIEGAVFNQDPGILEQALTT